MKTQIVAGNWKMNLDQEESLQLIDALKKSTFQSQAEVIVAPNFTALSACATALSGSKIGLSAQNMHQADKGAYTGEVSAPMLKGVGVNKVILGHSERREYFREDGVLLAAKVDTALAHDMQVIFCFGELLADRESGQHFEVVRMQLTEGLFHLPRESWTNLILAYEPVWAIGTGKTASPEQAQEMHAFIRQTVADFYNSEIADNCPILYGGSVKPDNAPLIFSKPDVDGGLIGGAALNASDFTAIVNAL
jgi:triosephosphate isomerase